MVEDAPSWVSQKWPFFVNAARSRAAQLKAVAAIVGSWRWRKVNVIHEDMPASANGNIAELLSAIQEAESEINELLPLPSMASNETIVQKLESLKRGRCRVFIVQSSTKLARNVFTAAKSIGMMEKDFVWITTTEISNSIDAVNSPMASFMQGILGIKIYLPCKGRLCEDFVSRFKKTLLLQYPDEAYADPNTSALEAYDAVWAAGLAMKGKEKGRDLLDRVLQSDFEGLTGLVRFRDSVLSPIQVFQVINVVHMSYRQLGYWSEGVGFSQNATVGQNYSKSMEVLGEVLWPGDSLSVPRGWAIATRGKLLKIGVPSNATFEEFVRVRNSAEGYPIVEGFSIDVFKSAKALLPYDLQYTFVPHEGSYNSLVEQVHLKVM